MRFEMSWRNWEQVKKSRNFKLKLELICFVLVLILYTKISPSTYFNKKDQLQPSNFGYYFFRTYRRKWKISKRRLIHRSWKGVKRWVNIFDYFCISQEEQMDSQHEATIHRAEFKILESFISFCSTVFNRSGQ